MNLNQLIYDIVVTYFIKGNRTYATSVAANLRGTEGPVSKGFKDYYYFGREKEIDIGVIRKRLIRLVQRGYLREMNDQDQPYYVPSNMKQASTRYLIIKNKNEELKKTDW